MKVSWYVSSSAHNDIMVCVGAQLTSANQGLLVVGMILLSVAIVLGVIITWMVFKKGIICVHKSLVRKCKLYVLYYVR